MRDTLIIVNYMRSNPPIIDDYVHGMKTRFKKIYIVNRNTDSEYENIKDIEGVFIREVRKRDRSLLLYKSVIRMFSRSAIKDFFSCVKLKQFSLKWLVSSAEFYHTVTLLRSVLDNISETRKFPERVSMLALFYTSEAFAIAELKQKYPALRTVSMAHSHEIGAFTSQVRPIIGKWFMQNKLDSICFISQRKMDTYIETICQPLDLPTENFKLLYWGSRYEEFSNLPKRTECYPIIVSCSTVEGLKRVSMIAESIRISKNRELHWYHFGDGAFYNELISQVDAFPDEVKERIHLMGRVPNSEVKKFYAATAPSLFVNVSTVEGLPISVMEALSYRIPSLVTDVGGEREIIEDGYNGYVVGKDITAEELAQRIDEHLALPDDQLVQLRNNAFEMWSARFDLEKNLIGYKGELQ